MATLPTEWTDGVSIDRPYGGLCTGFHQPHQHATVRSADLTEEEKRVFQLCCWRSKPLMQNFKRTTKDQKSSRGVGFNADANGTANADADAEANAEYCVGIPLN